MFYSLGIVVVISLIRDAIRTSKLSRRWKKLYGYRSNLEFNWRDIISDAADTWTPGTVSIFNAWYFQRSIDAFLASYLGSKVESFKLHCCFGNKHPHCFNGRIEFTVTKGAEILDLAFSSDKISERTWTRIDHYDFPTQLLPRGEGSNLRHLKLRTCKLMSDKIFVDRFSAITTLVFVDVR